MSDKWADIYLKNAVKRLQPHIKGLTLNISTVSAMQQLCSYETVALGYSAFCDLFTEEEWLSYDYKFDLSFWYSNGPGGVTVAAQYAFLFPSFRMIWTEYLSVQGYRLRSGTCFSSH
jgi:hypothetical protein